MHRDISHGYLYEAQKMKTKRLLSIDSASPLPICMLQQVWKWRGHL